MDKLVKVIDATASVYVGILNDQENAKKAYLDAIHGYEGHFEYQVYFQNKLDLLINSK